MKFSTIALGLSLSIGTASVAIASKNREIDPTNDNFSINEIALSANEQFESRSITTSKGGKSMKSGKGSRGSKHGADQCGVNGTAACFQRLEPINSNIGQDGLEMCLSLLFEPQEQVVLYSNSDGDFQVNKVSFPEDDGFRDAMLGPGSNYGKRYPAAIVFAETKEEVKKVMDCAKTAGYKISPRGRGHHYQGLSRMDGQVVIDLSLLCDTNDFEIVQPNRPDGSTNWILPGQKWINSVTSGPGCTNAVMLAYNGRNNTVANAEGGIYTIGSCPSVGIVGYVTGGGSGDATPYVGYGSDDLVEFDMILANGTEVTANKYNNTDLFWATQGGGSGLGIITSLTRAVIASPEPEAGKERKFSVVRVNYSTPEDSSRKRFLGRFQNFLYDNPNSVRFGGNGAFKNINQEVFGLFLGSAEEFQDIFNEAGLFDGTADDDASTLAKNYVISNLPSNLPATGVQVAEFDSYTEAMLYKICLQLVGDPGSTGAGYIAWSKTDWCDDLGINPALCGSISFPNFFFAGLFQGFPEQTVTFIKETESCLDPDVIEKFADAAYNPKSFFNRAGSSLQSQIGSEQYQEYISDACNAPGPGFEEFCKRQAAILGKGFAMGTTLGLGGGIMIPRLHIDVLDEIVKEVGLGINHLQHGAASIPHPGDTALGAQRGTAILTPVASPTETVTYITNTLVNKHYDGDASALQGYFNYPSPIGNPDWRKFYFGENYERLSKIKRKYDPTSIFDIPNQPQPAASKE